VDQAGEAGDDQARETSVDRAWGIASNGAGGKEGDGAMNSASDAVIIVQDLANTGFWGSLELTFQGGKIVLLKKTETLKPNQRNNRGDDRDRG